MPKEQADRPTSNPVQNADRERALLRGRGGMTFNQAERWTSVARRHKWKFKMCVKNANTMAVLMTTAQSRMGLNSRSSCLTCSSFTNRIGWSDVSVNGSRHSMPPELTDAGGQWRPNWKLKWSARGRSSDLVCASSFCLFICQRITAASARTHPSPGIHACKRRSARVPRSVWREHLSPTRRRDWLRAIGAW
jgi:hypothetical protein